MSEDVHVERLVRDGLHRRAEQTDVSAPVLEAARAAARRHRRRGLVAGGVLAASIAVVAGGTVVGLSGDDRQQASNTPGRPVDPAGWRTEYWHDVQVDVPADWGWGRIPDVSGDTCGYDRGPYVGRPVDRIRVCDPVLRDGEPAWPYVWLGVDLPVGTVDLGGGWARETEQVAGTTVSVATQDDRVRERILDSARSQALCPPDGGAAPSASQGTEGTFGLRPQRLVVCAYLPREGGFEQRGHVDLSYAAILGADAAAEFASAVHESPRLTQTCPPNPAGFAQTLVSLRLEGPADFDDRVQRTYAVDFDFCGGVSIDTPAGPELGTSRRLTLETVEPWADDGVRSVLPDFIGPEG